MNYKLDKWRLGLGIFDIAMGLGFLFKAGIDNSFALSLCAVALLVIGSISIPVSFETEKIFNLKPLSQEEKEKWEKISEKIKNKKTYDTDVRCNNCTGHNTLEIKKGTTTKEYLKKKIICTRCQCILEEKKK